MESEPSWKVLIINSNEEFNKAAVKLISLMSGAIEVQSINNAAEAPQKWRKMSPNYVLVNVENNGFILPEVIKRELPGVMVIGMLLFNDDLKYYYDSKFSSFDGFVSQEYFKEQIVHFIHTKTSV